MDAKAEFVPSNVPRELVRDFDYNAPPGIEDGVHEAWHRLHDGPDIFWTPHHGGHWVLTRAEDVEYMMKTYEIFSMHGLTIPKIPTPHRLLPLEEDPPVSTPFRNLIQPFFLPKAVKNLEADVRAITTSLIDSFHAKGECEFIGDFAQHLPIIVFLKMVNLPLEDRPQLLAMADGLTRGTTVEVRNQAVTDLMAYLEKWIVERRLHPGEDIISKIANATINGRPITDVEIRSLLTLVVFGGLDTVASSLGFIANALALHPDLRRQLIDNPNLVPGAVEELLRRHGITGDGRELTRDLEYKGISFRKGDLVWIQTLVYGLDDSKFKNPMQIDLTRRGVPHAAFGFGPHHCPGAYVGRTELKVFIQEWLRRIPDFHVKPGERIVARSGSICSVLYLPLQWTVP